MSIFSNSHPLHVLHDLEYDLKSSLSAIHYISFAHLLVIKGSIYIAVQIFQSISVFFIHFSPFWKLPAYPWTHVTMCMLGKYRWCVSIAICRSIKIFRPTTNLFLVSQANLLHFASNSWIFPYFRISSLRRLHTGDSIKVKRYRSDSKMHPCVSSQSSPWWCEPERRTATS